MPEEYDGYQLTEYREDQELQDLTPPWGYDDQEEDAPHD